VRRGARILLWLLVLVGLTACNSRRFLYLERAAVVEDCRASDERPPGVQRLLAGHHIERGRALVLIGRTFDPGSLLTIDDETYKKLTIEIPTYDPDVPIKIPGPGLKVFYTTGSAAWVRRAVGVSSTNATGAIVIRNKTRERLTAKIDLIVHVKEPLQPPDRASREVKIQEEHTFTKIDLEDLTPWLGTCHPSPSKEVYP